MKEKCDSLTRIKNTAYLLGRIAAFAASCSFLITGLEAQPPQKLAIPLVHGKSRHAPVKAPIVAPEIPVEAPPPPPPPPLTPEQRPPERPQVSWDGKLLTITSGNSTLSDILTEVRNLTGADIDIPPNASKVRIASELGPGPAREVLSTLLSWTDFDYVIQASDGDAAGIHSVLLTAREKTDGSAARDAAMVASNMGRSAYGNAARRAIAEEPTVPETEATTSVETASGAEAPPAVGQAKGSGQLATPVDSPATAAQSAVSSNLEPAQPDLTSSVAMPDSAVGQAPLSESEQRVVQMQNMFEQRKQMIEDSRKPPAN